MPLRERLRPAWPYAVAVTAVLAAMAACLVLAPFVGRDAPMLLFVVAVTIAAWYGSGRAGVLALVLSLVIGAFLFPEAPNLLEYPTSGDVARVLVFTVSGAIIVALTEALHRSRARALDDNASLRHAEHALQADIAERERVEDQLRHHEQVLMTLIDAMPDCISFKDGQGHWLVANQAQLTLFQLHGIDYRGKTDQELSVYSPAAREELLRCAESDERAWRSGKLTHCEEVVGDVDGSRQIFDVIKVPLYKPDGRRKAMVAIGRDVTERKQAERERAQLLDREKAARTEAEQASRAKDDFLATLSHELRTPLTAVLGWAQMLLRLRDHTAQTRHGLEVIERSAQEQSQIVKDLLDVSGLVKGTLQLQVEPVDLAQVVEASLEAVRLAAQAKRIRLALQLDPVVGLVRGDRARLQQVVWNLLSNGVKFTPEGGEVAVRLERVDGVPDRGDAHEDGAPHARLSIRDTGIGIDPQFLPFLFERFRQGDSSRTRRYGGLGMGLAIVRHLVEMHGGTVRAESAGAGRGTTFIVELPLLVGDGVQARP